VRVFLHVLLRCHIHEGKNKYSMFLSAAGKILSRVVLLLRVL
jgi:hypothetical protein